jgi:GNAT superfamily N-acetyltransferase
MPQPIRTATASDLAAILCLTNRAFAVETFFVTGERTDAEDIRTRFAEGVFLVIDDETKPDQLIGSVYVSVKNGRGYLGLISIDPDHQGRGLSRRLVAAVDDHCRQAGCNFIDLTVVNVRENLFPFYAKFGYHANDVIAFPVPERQLMPVHLVRLTKALCAPHLLAAPG